MLESQENVNVKQKKMADDDVLHAGSVSQSYFSLPGEQY